MATIFDEHELVYFTPNEFRRTSFALPVQTSLLEKIHTEPLSLFDPRVLELLDQTREYAQVPFVLTCSFRSAAYDIAKGRSGNSAHTRGLAFDIACKTDHQRFKIVTAAILCGWKRIGVYSTWIHLDADPSLAQQVIWYGK